MATGLSAVHACGIALVVCATFTSAAPRGRRGSAVSVPNNPADNLSRHKVFKDLRRHTGDAKSAHTTTYEDIVSYDLYFV